MSRERGREGGRDRMCVCVWGGERRKVQGSGIYTERETYIERESVCV